MPAIYDVLCDYKMFQVNFTPSVGPNWKTAENNTTGKLHTDCSYEKFGKTQDNRFYTSKAAARQKVSDQLVGGFEFYLNQFGRKSQLLFA